MEDSTLFGTIRYTITAGINTTRQRLSFPVKVNIPVAAGHYQMHVQIFDKDTKPNNLMGDGIVDLKKVLRDKEHDGYFPLNFRGRQGTGVIYLELTFYSAVSKRAVWGWSVLQNSHVHYSKIQRDLSSR